MLGTYNGQDYTVKSSEIHVAQMSQTDTHREQSVLGMERSFPYPRGSVSGAVNLQRCIRHIVKNGPCLRHIDPPVRSNHKPGSGTFTVARNVWRSCSETFVVSDQRGRNQSILQVLYVDFLFTLCLHHPTLIFGRPFLHRTLVPRACSECFHAFRYVCVSLSVSYQQDVIRGLAASNNL